jgi:hypothetical protein
MTVDLRPLLFPPDKGSSNIVDNVGMAQSPFTGGQQVTELPGARWQLRFQYSNLNIQQGRLLKAIAAMLRSGGALAHIYDFAYIARRSTEPGVPLIAGAAQTGNILVVDGVTPNLVNAYMIGDQISYLSTDGCYRMHIVTANVNASAGGVCNIPIHMPMRNPPVDNDPLISVQPSVTVIADGRTGQVEIAGNVVSVDFALVEALYAIA